MVGDVGGASRCVMPLVAGNIDMYEQEWIYIYIYILFSNHKKAQANHSLVPPFLGAMDSPDSYL